MNFNFFDWIRDGVRRSVLLGVSDATQQLGMPPDEDKARDTILAFLQDDSDVSNRGQLTGPTTGGRGGRKLGKSITDIHPVK